MFSFIHDFFHPTTSNILSGFEKMISGLMYRVSYHSAQSDGFQKAANAHQLEAERAAKAVDNLTKLVNG